MTDPSSERADVRRKLHRLVLWGEVEEGVRFARQTRERALAEGDRELAAEAAHREGELQLEEFRMAEALEIHQRALEEREEVLGPLHADTSSTRSAIAHTAWCLGKGTSALKMMARALDSLPSHPTDEDRRAVASVLRNAGGLAGKRNETGKAATLLRRALETVEGGGSPEPLEIASACVALSAAEEQVGRLDETQALLDRAIEIRRREFGGDHLYIAYALDHMAGLALRRQDREAAWRLFEEGAAMIERCRGPAHHSLATPLVGLATIAAMREEKEAALGYAGRAIAVSEASFGPQSHLVAQPVSFLALLEAGCARRPDLAAPLWRRAAELWLPVHAAHSESLCQCFNNLLLCLRTQGRCREFRDFAGPVLDRLEKDPEATSDLLAALANAVSEAWFKDGRSGEALRLLQRALSAAEVRFGVHSPEIVPVLSNLASVLRSMGRGREAREHERRMKKLRRRSAWN